jgi:hypothetical protein
MRLRSFAFAILIPTSLAAESTAPSAPTTKGLAESEAGVVTAPVQNAHGLQFASRDVDFGRIADGEVVTVEFPVTNVTDKPIKITKIQPSCGCTATQGNPTSVAPKKTEVIKVQFNSAGRPGPTHKSLTVYTDEQATPEYRLTFRGSVKSEIFLPRTVVDFGQVEKGQKPLQAFSLLADTTDTITILSATSADERFTVTPTGSKAGQDGGTEFTFDVVLDSTLAQGDMDSRVTIVTSHPKTPTHFVTLRANILGAFAYSPTRITAVLNKDAQVSRQLTITSRKDQPFTIGEPTHDLQVPIEFSITDGARPAQKVLKALIKGDGTARPLTGRLRVPIENGDGSKEELEIPMIVQLREPRIPGARAGGPSPLSQPAAASTEAAPAAAAESGGAPAATPSGPDPLGE